ncbi:DUF4870 domain-containing protein [Halorubellus sp. JP-L1]|uniref:DUF4870 domain-containing protein n=1 Tax=Halorubellus sp. JP-L1 TaxID=2715753 RepID=UPI0014081D5C|nr:DUF4870 domain-containing protein [Halorubellus sp. JP-L1]NHN43591.1 DUF4870 domain-containing protein [Halorubellus sp. JP-L1]
MATEDVDNTTSTDEPTTAEPTSGTGLESNLAGALAYLFGALTGILFYVLEPEDEFVRFHAAQSIALSVGFFVLAIASTIVTSILGVLAGSGTGAGLAFGLVSLVVSLLWLVVALAGFGLWLFLMLRAYQGERTRIPVLADVADRIA